MLSGRRIVPDFRWPAQRLVVEADGAAWHDHRIAREDDAERQALLEDHGERVLRVTWEQAVGRDRTRGSAGSAPPAPRPGGTSEGRASLPAPFNAAGAASPPGFGGR